MEHEYQQEDEYVIFHENDPDLDTIKIKLPRLEEWYSDVLKRPVSREEALTFVDGYGLPPEKQKFTHQEMPEKLKLIYEVVFNKKHATNRTRYKEVTDVRLEDLYEEIETNQKYYASEIVWIKTQIKRRYIGYWCFINGKPTYLNGANYFFLNFWPVKNFGKNNNRADYRDYQRQIFHFLMYCYTTHEAFYKHRITYRENGAVKVRYSNRDVRDVVEEMKEMDVEYYVEPNIAISIDMGRRTVHGANFVSGRRIAKTAISCCFCTWGTLNMPDQTFIIQAMNEDQAINKIFVKQIQTPVSKLPFFFRPHYRGKLEAKQGLRFQYEGSVAAAARAGMIPEQMECFITPLTSNEKAADGEAEIAFVYRDEPAKKTDAKAADQNIPTWWYNTMKPAIERGRNIRGFCVMPSTVGDMESGGGSQFFEIANESHFSDRNENGTTASGLINFFLPGYYALEGYIDEYGASVVEDPPEPVMSNDGKWIKEGAKTHLLNQAEYFEKKKQWGNLIKLQQNFPMSWKQAFAVIPKDMGMPIEKMRDRISELKFSKTPLSTKINLKWVGNKFGGDVFIENDPKGKWTMTFLPPIEQRNLRVVVSAEEGYVPPKEKGLIYAPDPSVMNKFFLACDPVKFHRRNTVGKKKSNAAAAIFYKRDSQVDPDTKPRNEWVSNDWVMIYNHPVDDKEEYHEEWLKAAILFGAYVYPEWPDGESIVEYFRENGFDGYLLKDVGTDGKQDSRPGVWAGVAEQNEMAGDIMTFFYNNARYVKIWEILDEWTQMRGIDDLTNHDLCAATGWCMRAIKSRMPDIYKDVYRPIEVTGGFDTYSID
jgi:hypothetical protein